MYTMFSSRFLGMFALLVFTSVIVDANVIERHLIKKRDVKYRYRLYPGTGNFYKLVTEPLTWLDARKYCTSEGHNHHLAVPKTGADYNALGSLVKTWSKDKPVWVGISDIDTEGTFLPVHGPKSLPYLNWLTGDPNNDGDLGEDCVEFKADVGNKLNDYLCSEKNAFICEYAK